MTGRRLASAAPPERENCGTVNLIPDYAQAGGQKQAGGDSDGDGCGLHPAHLSWRGRGLAVYSGQTKPVGGLYFAEKITDPLNQVKLQLEARPFALLMTPTALSNRFARSAR